MKKNILGIILMGTIAFTSCTKSDDIETPTRATAQEFEAVKQVALDSKIQEFQFNADDGIASLTSDNGVNLIIDGTCLTLNGNAVAGSVDVEFVELFKKGDMLTTNKPTMGVLPNGDKALLISGGEFLVKVSQNGAELQTNCDFQLIIPASLTGSEDQDMTLWAGNIDTDGNLEWDEVDNAGENNNDLFAEGGKYYAFCADFGWTNVDKFYNDSRPKTELLVDVPDGYDNSNSAVYLSYDGEAPALANLDSYDGSTGLFSEHYGQIPIGLECHVIFISEENGSFKYAIKSVTIAENDTISFTDNETNVGTQDQLTQLINDLP